MEGGTVLDSAVFQLTPTRTRCELVVWSGRLSLKLASGLVKPFVCHLKAAEEQFDKGGYSIILEVPAGHERSWFTKGTVERFVRFVSTPEVLERVNTIELEIVQIAESISVQCSEVSAATDKPPKAGASRTTEANKMMVDSNLERQIVAYKPRRELVDEALPAQGENSKIQLLRVLENRKMMLQKEQGMAYARAAAAGFDTQYMADLVSFAEIFGAFRLRKACLNIMDLRKRKQEAGVWLEMELNTIEDSSVQAETPVVGASGIILTSNSVVSQSKVHPACDDPSKQSSLSETVTLPNANGHHANSSHNKDNESSMEGISAGMAGGNGYLPGYTQQSTMPGWPAQPLQYMQNFQSHIAGHGPPLQGFHGLPMQNFQLGSPYYQSYPGNSYWPQHIGDPRFGPAQRAESSGLSNMSGLKQNAADETEVGSTESFSRSQSLIDKGEHSDLENESMVQHSKMSVSPHRKSSSRRRRIRTGRSGNKRSGMVVIRNINYVTSKGYNGIVEEDVSDKSNSESDSDSRDDLKQKVGDMIGLSEKNQKHTGRLSKRKGFHNKKDGEHELSTENEGVNDENSSWQLFQKCLLRNDELSESKSTTDNNDSFLAVAEDDRQKCATISNGNNFVGRNIGSLDRSSNNYALLEPGMGTKDYITRGDTGLKTIFELEAIGAKAMPEIKKTISDEKLLLPERANSTMVVEDTALTYQREQLSILKSTAADDSFIVSKQHTEMELANTDSQWGARVDDEHTITGNSDQLHREKYNGQCLVDDSFMVPTRSTVHEHANREWMTDINMDSEATPVEKVKHLSYNKPKNKSETSILWEPAELFMIPERNSERDSIRQAWNPVTDNDPQVLVNNADNMYLDEDCNGQVNELGSLPRKQNDKIVKELPGMKMGCKDGQLKAIEEVPAKKGAEMAVRSGKSAKSTPLAEAQLRAQQLRSFKAGLQKTKTEKEEEERKRIEDLKIQRQQRIAGRTASSVNKSTTNSHLSRQQQLQQQLKHIPTTKLSLSFQKSRNTPRLSTEHSLPAPVKKVSTEAINRLSSHKQKSNQSKETVSQSIPSQSGLKRENVDSSRQKRLAAPLKRTPDNVKKSSRQASKTENGDNVNANGKSSISSKIVTKGSNEKAMDSNGSNILNKENGSISSVKKKSNPALFLQMGERGDRLKANGMVSKSSANDLDSLNSKKKQSLVAKKISSPVSKLNGGSHKVPLDLKSSQKNHPDSAAMQALRNCEESNLDSNAVTIKSKEDIDVYVTEKHINDSTSQSEEISQPLKSDHSKTVEDKEQVEISPLDCNSGKRGQGSINSRDFATRDSTSSLPVLKLDRVQQSRDCHATTVEGLIDEEFEIAEVAEAASTPLTQVATSHSPNSRQLDMQPDRRNSFQAPSFKLQKRDLEEPTEATVVHNSSSDELASNSFEFRLTSGNDIASEEISTPKVRIFEFGSPLATASDPPKSSPQLQNVPTLPPSASPVTDNGKSDSANSRKKWGNSESTAKGLRRLLMFGRKSRTSQAEKDVASSRGALVSV